MKKSAKFLSIFFSLIVMSVFVSSCSDDDNNGPMSDPASAIVGEYVGTGLLAYGGNVSSYKEKYDGMKIVVTKSSNEYAIVTPYYADDTYFFPNDDSHGIVFKISETAAGDFILTSDLASKTKLTITKKGHMTFDYPYVALGSVSGYSLVFEGDKQKK